MRAKILSPVTQHFLFDVVCEFASIKLPCGHQRKTTPDVLPESPSASGALPGNANLQRILLRVLHQVDETRGHGEKPAVAIPATMPLLDVAERHHQIVPIAHGAPDLKRIAASNILANRVKILFR